MQNYKNKEYNNFEYLNLQGINLQGSDLRDASFKGANLKDADLSGADLSNAKLVETNLDGADLSEAILTGACIENWEITAATKTDNIKCEYLYLRQETPGDSNRLRKPEKEDEPLSWKELKQLLTPPEKEFPVIIISSGIFSLKREKVLFSQKQISQKQS